MTLNITKKATWKDGTNAPFADILGVPVIIYAVRNATGCTNGKTRLKDLWNRQAT